MRTLTSTLRPSGHVALVRLPEGASFQARYVDDIDVRDITGLVPDLLLSGALDEIEARAAQRPEPDESVVAAVVSYHEPLLPGQVRDVASFSWLHLASGESGDFGPQSILGLVVRGIAVELTAGVVREATQGAVPVDPSDLVPTDGGEVTVREE